MIVFVTNSPTTIFLVFPISFKLKVIELTLCNTNISVFKICLSDFQYIFMFVWFVNYLDPMDSFLTIARIFD